MRLTKIYTRKGDDGYTNLGDERIPKDDILLEVVGTLDELNSCLGLIVSYEPLNQKILQIITRIQNELFCIGGELHLPERPVITANHVTDLESFLDNWNKTLPPLKEFVLPRGTAPAAACHLARTVCRRAERLMVKLHRQAALTNPELLRYLNRLSDLLFVLARILAREGKSEEQLWEHEQEEEKK